MLPQIEYSGIVWALSHNDPEPLIEHSIKKITRLWSKERRHTDSRCAK